MSLIIQYLPDAATLLQAGFVHSTLIAAVLLGLISGTISPLVVIRQMSLTVYGTSELALMGTSVALLPGVSISSGATIGSVSIIIVLATLSLRGRQDAVVGVALSFGMGLLMLFVHLYPGRTSTAFSLLTGQTIGLTDTSLWTMAIVAVIVVGGVAWKWWLLLFASTDPIMVVASGVNVKALSIHFAILTGLVAAQGVQIAGPLLVITPAITLGAATAFVTASSVKAIILSTIFAEFAAVGDIVLSLTPGIPVSVLVTTVALIVCLFCYVIGAMQSCKAIRDDAQAVRRSK